MTCKNNHLSKDYLSLYGKDRNQSLTPVKKPLPLPQTGENNKMIFMIAGLVIVAMVGAWFGLSTSKKKKNEQKQMNKIVTDETNVVSTVSSESYDQEIALTAMTLSVTVSMMTIFLM